MTTKNKALIGVGVASMTTLGVLVFLKLKKEHDRKQEQILDTIADEGYETAYDVLYPLKKNRLRRFF